MEIPRDVTKLGLFAALNKPSDDTMWEAIKQEFGLTEPPAVIAAKMKTILAAQGQVGMPKQSEQKQEKTEMTTFGGGQIRRGQDTGGAAGEPVPDLLAGIKAPEPTPLQRKGKIDLETLQQYLNQNKINTQK
jgi:hypothetical protein